LYVEKSLGTLAYKSGKTQIQSSFTNFEKSEIYMDLNSQQCQSTLLLLSPKHHVHRCHDYIINVSKKFQEIIKYFVFYIFDIVLKLSGKSIVELYTVFDIN
jgi:hypothetical protein